MPRGRLYEVSLMVKFLTRVDITAGGDTYKLLIASADINRNKGHLSWFMVVSSRFVSKMAARRWRRFEAFVACR